jgi:hypothetical protein
MYNFLHHLNILSTILANLSLGPTDLKMFIQVVDEDELATKLALLRFILTAWFMLTKNTLHGCESAELTTDLYMFCLLMLLFLCFRHALATSSTLEILSGASHLVHSEAGDIDLLVANGTKLGLLLLLNVHNYVRIKKYY